MKKALFQLQFLTPALIAGAYPKTVGEHKATAEMRVASIRGQLRWWHRLLGNDSASENRIFGSAAGEWGNASGVMLRLLDPPACVTEPECAKQMGLWPGQIVEYLAFNLRLEKDARSAIRPGTQFHLLAQSMRLSEADWNLFVKTMTIFGWLGSLGTRSRRCFGALTLVGKDATAVQRPTNWQSLLPPNVEARLVDNISERDLTQFFIRVGNWLRIERSNVANKNLLFGTAGTYSRRASSILLRPDLHEGNYRLLAVGRTSDLDQTSLRPSNLCTPTPETRDW